MATSNLTTPGVYVQEISTLPPSIAPVATAIPAFIGYTETGTAFSPKRVSSMIEFEANFGGPAPQTFDIDIIDTPASGALISRTFTAQFSSGFPNEFQLYQSMQFYFANGGGPCYVVSSGDYASSPDYLTQIKTALDALEKEDEPTLILAPDMVGTTLASSYGTYVQDVLKQCNKLQDRFGIFDYPANTLDFSSGGDIETYRSDMGTNALKYGASYMPFLNTIFKYGVDKASSTIASYNGSDSTINALVGASLDDGSTSDVKTLNFPIYQQILSVISNSFSLTLPPSAGMAGIYAATDNDRGVWKAPANVSINSITGPSLAITEAQQGLLNVDATSGKSINAIRSFVGRGTVVWGARTLDGNSNEWRYVPVRRLFIFIEESTKKATEFVVFEPNDKNTWLRVKAMISNFLTDLWRQGALAGDKPDQAFFVKVGLNETMTAQDILEGKMIVTIGLAAVRPAEFIILQFMHKVQEA